MKPTCRKLQDTLATEGPRAFREDAAAQRHLADCSGCFAFLESLSELDAGLENLKPVDAPEHVVESLLLRPEIARAGKASSIDEGPGDRRRWPAIVTRLGRGLRTRPLVWSSAAAAMLVLALSVSLHREKPLGPTTDNVEIEKYASSTTDRRAVPDEEPAQKQAEGSPGRELEDVDELRALESFGDDRPVSTTEQQHRNSRGAAPDPVPPRRLPPQKAKGQDKNEAGEGRADARGSRSRDFEATVSGVTTVDPFGGKSGVLDANPNSIEEMETIMDRVGLETDRWRGRYANQLESGKPSSPTAPETEFLVGLAESNSPSGPRIAGAGEVTPPQRIEESYVEPAYPEGTRLDPRLDVRVTLELLVRKDGTVGRATVLRCDRPGHGFEEAALEAARQWRYTPAVQDGKPVDVFFTDTVTFEAEEQIDESGALERRSSSAAAVAAARAFLEDRARLEGLTFRPASGYWANTYVPGDPVLRLLQARLRARDRGALQADAGLLPRLHDASRQVAQPFDEPEGSALAVYLHADRRGITEEGRMLVQVGLQGTPRHGGRRPALNLGLVLDLRGEIPGHAAIGVRALIEAFNRAKQPGDRMRLVVAGRSGGTVVEPEQFRHGYLKVTLDRLLAEDAAAGNEPVLDLVDAVAAAVEDVASVDDPSRPLGASAVLLIAARPLGQAGAALTDLAHQSAVAGVPLSVVGVGPAVEPSELDRLALAGQGNRRLLEQPSDAVALVDRELSAVCRVVARAVRLRIRLAPGVKLIDVLGSERLDERRAERVRDAERSLDLRLARNLGIEADRGQDEEGIQIVIPSFYAGDSHIFLLDVTVPGPGAIAEVTVRYKDLVHLRNGVGRASLGLGGEQRAAGPLERNVLKNLLSLRLSRTLDQAGRALASTDDRPRAARLLNEFRTLLEGLRLEVPGLDNDPEISSDLAMLGEYETLLTRGVAAVAEGRAHLSDSLRYAARLKLLPPPLETGS